VRLQTDRGCKIVAGHAIFATGYEALEFLPMESWNVQMQTHAYFDLIGEYAVPRAQRTAELAI
jgi:hypothetical protein